MLIKWTLGGAFGFLGSMFLRTFNDQQHNISNEDSSEDNIDELVERQIANYELMVRQRDNNGRQQNNGGGQLGGGQVRRVGRHHNHQNMRNNQHPQQQVLQGQN